jgi:hypothetical protein
LSTEVGVEGFSEVVGGIVVVVEEEVVFEAAEDAGDVIEVATVDSDQLTAAARAGRCGAESIDETGDVGSQVGEVVGVAVGGGDNGARGDEGGEGSDEVVEDLGELGDVVGVDGESADDGCPFMLCRRAGVGQDRDEPLEVRAGSYQATWSPAADATS